MTQYQKGMLVMNYLEKLEASPLEILDAVCDENLEQSYELIKENLQITKAEFMQRMGITEY